VTPATLDAYAKRAGGYVAAALQEQDFADQFTGLGDPFFDWLAAKHRQVSRALALRGAERYAETARIGGR